MKKIIGSKIRAACHDVGPSDKVFGEALGKLLS